MNKTNTPTNINIKVAVAKKWLLALRFETSRFSLKSKNGAILPLRKNLLVSKGKANNHYETMRILLLSHAREMKTYNVSVGMNSIRY